MEVADIRAAFTLLGFEEPIKDAARVRTRWRALMLESSPDLTTDPEEIARRTEHVRHIHAAKKVADEFCASSFSLEELEQAGHLDRDVLHQEYLKKVHLFIGRIHQRRYKHWTRVNLFYPESFPEFDQNHPKSTLSATQQGIFQILDEENRRDEVKWTLDFLVQDSMAWVAMEMVDGTYQAAVFFTTPPTHSHILPERSHTTITREAILAVLRTTDLHKVRGVRGAEFWAEFQDDPWMIQVSENATSLCWMTMIEGTMTPIPFYRVSSVEEFTIALPSWVARVKEETWDGPL